MIHFAKRAAVSNSKSQNITVKFLLAHREWSDIRTQVSRNSMVRNLLMMKEADVELPDGFNDFRKQI